MSDARTCDQSHRGIYPSKAEEQEHTEAHTCPDKEQNAQSLSLRHSMSSGSLSLRESWPVLRKPQSEGKNKSYF